MFTSASSQYSVHDFAVRTHSKWHQWSTVTQCSIRSMRGGIVFRNRGPSLKVHHGQCPTSMTKHDSGGSPPSNSVRHCHCHSHMILSIACLFRFGRAQVAQWDLCSRSVGSALGCWVKGECVWSTEIIFLQDTLLKQNIPWP